MFLISSLTLHVRLSRRLAFFCQSLTEINVAVQQLDNVGREVKLCMHIGCSHYVSVTSGFRCVDFCKWFQPRDQKDPKPTRKEIAFNFGAGSTSERIKIFPATVFHAHGHPMTTGSVRGVGIADEETQTIG